MHGQILVSLLKALVLAHKVQVVAPDDNRALHLHLEHDASEDAPTDRHIAGERTLLVNVVSLNRLTRCLESQPYTLDMAWDLDGFTGNNILLFVEKYSRLLLKSTCSLNAHQKKLHYYL